MAIEGLFPPPHMVSARMKIDFGQRFREWVEDQRKISSRMPKRYATMDEALQRMQSENKHLSAAQAEHLTRHGMLQNEDSSFSWKFDNYVRSFSPVVVEPTSFLMKGTLCENENKSRCGSCHHPAPP